MQKIRHADKTIIIHDDGSMTVEMDDGRKFNMDAQGNTNIDLRSIKSVGIKNIVDLTQYTITQHEGLVVHTILYNNGGRVSFSYDTSGKLEKFSCTKASLSISKDNEIMISAFTEEAAS